MATRGDRHDTGVEVGSARRKLHARRAQYRRCDDARVVHFPAQHDRHRTVTTHIWGRSSHP